MAEFFLDAHPMRTLRSILERALAVALLAPAMAAAVQWSAPVLAVDPDIRAAIATITAEEIQGHTEILASDEFEGRAPASRGETLTVDYLVEQFQAIGLEPGNPDGTFRQGVPLVRTLVGVDSRAHVGEATIELEMGIDIAGLAYGGAEFVATDVPLVFVGHGIVTEDGSRNDYEGANVSGTIAVMLAVLPDDPKLARYTSWVLRANMAGERGAVAAVFLWNEPSVPFSALAAQFVLPRFARPGSGPASIPIVLMNEESLDSVLRRTGASLKSVVTAMDEDFRPVGLGVALSLSISVEADEVVSNNVVGLVRGSDPEIADELVVMTGHWDHLGRDPNLEGDQIYNGAEDNATGIGVMLEIAEALAGLPTSPRRSVLFIATTAEEQGLLGARHYVANPLYPLEKTVANINFDWSAPYGRTGDVVLNGPGNTTLEEVLAEAAAVLDRVVKPNPLPQDFYAGGSDHFPFAQEGIPALFAGSGFELIDAPEGYGRQRHDEYFERHYHQVSDEIRDDFDYSGLESDGALFLLVALLVANADEPPHWKEGTQYPSFKAKHEARR